MGQKRRRIYDLAAMLCFAGLVALPVWFATCALGPKLGLVDGRFALESLTLTWGIVLSGVVALAALTGVGLMISLRRTDFELPHGSWVPIAALVVAATGLTASVTGYSLYYSQPAVSEITTDDDNPPNFSEALIRRRGVKANTLTHAGGFPPDAVIDAVVLEYDREAVIDALLSLARDRRWRVGSVARRRGQIELTIESFWYMQTDDVVIRLTEAGADRTRLDYRAAARSGGRDGGRNARRLARIEAEIRERLG